MAGTLILITNHFPFGEGEAFIEAEYVYLQKTFDKVIIITRDVTSTGLRKGNFIFHRVNPVSSWKEYFLLFTLVIKNLKSTVECITDEIKSLRAQKRFKLTSFQHALHDLSKGLITSSHINQIFKRHTLTGNVVIYSYWLTSSALASTFVKDEHLNIKRVARAHGGDIHEERNAAHYLSFRNSLTRKLDKIFVASQNGIDYLKTKVEQGCHSKFSLARLGSFNEVSLEKKIFSSPPILVSCSFLVPVKRIDLLIEALSLIDTTPVHWIHIGGGPLESEIKNRAQDLLSGKQNIQYEFKGLLSQAEIQQFYRDNPVYLFINTSSSEGIPVSMMEAQSFGIPVLATNVGGVSELVDTGNGRLLDATATPKQIATAISEIFNMTESDYFEMRSNARTTWETSYNAEKNFSIFAQQLASLHEIKQ